MLGNCAVAFGEITPSVEPILSGSPVSMLPPST
jgi:hypothetical protein